MNRRPLLASTGLAALCALVSLDPSGPAAAAAGPGTARTKEIANAAEAFLDMLGKERRPAVQLPFAPQPRAVAAHFRGGLRGDVDMVGEQYGQAMWSNFPVSDVPRPGLRLGDLDQAQRDAVIGLLRAMLSDKGLRKVLDIMGSDQALALTGQPYACGWSAYTLAILGTPGVERPWMVQFGGHHLALNLAMLGGRGVLAPVLTGCLPALYAQGGRRVRVLCDENDKAFALLGSLDEAQRRQAVIDRDVSMLALGPGHDGEAVQPQGVKASTLDARQRAMLHDLILEWAGLLNDAHAAPRLAQIRDGLDDTWFAWSGPASHEPHRNGASYFRIQGPTLFIEFSPQAPGGDLTMHTHTIYRDLSNPYGRALA